MKAEGRKEGRVTILPVLNQGAGREKKGGKKNLVYNATVRV